MVINDLVSAVIGKLRQRTEYTSVAPYYIAQVLIELSENIEFEELKLTGPITNFIVQQAEYPLRNSIFTLSNEHRITFISSLFVWFNTSGQITVGVDTGKELDNRDFRVVNPMSKILGIPSVYCMFGDKRNSGVLIVGQMPDNPYNCQMRYQRQHPFTIPYGKLIQAQSDTNLAAILGQSEIMMPDDWSEIIIYATAEKICDDIGMNEIGMQYHQKLYGYKDKRGNDFPGLITVRQTQQQRQTSFNSRAMRPVVRRITG